MLTPPLLQYARATPLQVCNCVSHKTDTLFYPPWSYDFDGVMKPYHLPLHKYMSRILDFFLTFIQIFSVLKKKVYLRNDDVLCQNWYVHLRLEFIGISHRHWDDTEILTQAFWGNLQVQQKKPR